jgi:uncharacterized protein (DUF924 family)
MTDISAEDILQFWFEDIEHSCWFKKDAEFDRSLEQRFGAVLAKAKNDQLDHWCSSPEGILGLIVVLDQFSRNIHRESPMAFEADAKALQLAVDAINDGSDKALTLEQRSFLYLPLRHAEDLEMQKLGLKKTREINDGGYGSDRYALSHLALIERFGRFPHRNRVLGRINTDEEESYLGDSEKESHRG